MVYSCSLVSMNLETGEIILKIRDLLTPNRKLENEEMKIVRYVFFALKQKKAISN